MRNTAVQNGTGRASAGGSGGFTLVELLTIIIILGMLITLAAPSMLEARRVFRTEQTRAIIGMIQSAIASYREDWKDYPGERQDAAGRRMPLRLRGLPRSDGRGAGGSSLRGRYALVAALTGYRNDDGAKGPGARWDKQGRIRGPYVPDNMARGRSDGRTDAPPAFLDAFGNEIFYYRATTSDNRLFDPSENPDGPASLSEYLRDPNSNEYYVRHYVLITPGADRKWMKRTPELRKTDDVANFEFTFEKED